MPSDPPAELHCPICLELFVAPVMLECGHNYCQGCLARYWGDPPAQPGEASPCCCPECRHPVPGGKYTPNRALGQLADRARENTPAGEGQAGDEELLGEPLFCMDHGSLTRALETEHWGHCCLPLDETVQQYKETLTVSWTSLEARIQETKSLQDRSAQKVPEIAAQGLRLEQHLSTQFIELHQWLQQKEAALRQELRREEELLLSELETSRRNAQEIIRSTGEQIAAIQARLAEEDAAIFLKDIKSFLEKYCPREEKGAQLPAPRDFSLGQFKGPIQYMVWREMKSALSLALPRVTLDSATNHPNLQLSSDLLAVQLVDEMQEDVPEGPERFSKSVCVLGSAGFTSGRHYWEVEVGDKTSWDIGLARASVNRQEAKVMLKPANGYWAIWLRNGADYKALDSPSRHLALRAKPRRIGVYLDYEGGQVSFYDAATMTHLYTFSDAFTEPLYPMVSPGVNKDRRNAEPLRLLEL
ncbi:zinc-binding protein A33-like [Emydura macquarii macquarii]|uniref:zinc-binding protein A33-like n=1 Tax=Emydura macquarii macquarii TaxID=1129001 RepID=UPI00352A4C9C